MVACRCATRITDYETMWLPSVYELLYRSPVNPSLVDLNRFEGFGGSGELLSDGDANAFSAEVEAHNRSGCRRFRRCLDRHDRRWCAGEASAAWPFAGAMSDECCA